MAKFLITHFLAVTLTCLACVSIFLFQYICKVAISVDQPFSVLYAKRPSQKPLRHQHIDALVILYDHTFCARVHVCAARIHSCVAASYLIHTSCIIEFASGFSPLWWRQRAWRIRCYREAETRSRRGQQRRTGSLGLPDVHAARFPRSSCPLSALPSGAGGLPALLLTAGGWSWEGRDGKSAKRQKQKLQRQNARCQSPRRLLSASGIDRKGNVSWKSCAQSFAYFSSAPSGASCPLGTCMHTFSHTSSFAALK